MKTPYIVSHSLFVVVAYVCVFLGNITFYFNFSGEISVYLVKIKVVSITSELISYHFTSE